MRRAPCPPTSSACTIPPEPPCDPHDLPGADLFRNFKGITRDDLPQVVSRYMAFVTPTDMNHGLVIEALKQSGQYDDSLIIYMSDHGELLGARGPETMSKYNLYERSIRVPMIIKPPKGMIDDARRGSRCAEPVTLLDVLPTVLEAAEVDTLTEHLPGRSLLPLLRGETVERPLPVVPTDWFHRGQVNISVHAGDWKLILGPEDEELYHLSEDPWEFYNLANDSSYDGKRAELKARFVQYNRDVDARYTKKCQPRETQEWHPLTL